MVKDNTTKYAINFDRAAPTKPNMLIVKIFMIILNIAANENMMAISLNFFLYPINDSGKVVIPYT